MARSGPIRLQGRLCQRPGRAGTGRSGLNCTAGSKSEAERAPIDDAATPGHCAQAFDSA